MNPDNRYSRAVALSLLMALLAVFAPDVHSAPNDADLRELSRYELTMSDFRKYAAATASLAKHVKTQDEYADEELVDDVADAESLDDMAARIGRTPETRKAIESSGLTVRQYMVISMALLQATFAQYAVDQGADPAKVAKDAGVNPANLEFVKEHRAEIEKLNPRNAG